MTSTAGIDPARRGNRWSLKTVALGQVDRIVRSEGSGPSYVVVSAGPMLRRRYPVLHCTLVTRVDRRSGKLYVQAQRGSLERLSESPPLVL